MSDALPQKPFITPVPANETDRLAALHRYQILDTPSEVAFDRITTLAARLFNVPTALISLVDESRAWFKSCVGFNAYEVPRDATLCSFAVLTDEPLIVPDARLDDRFVCNPFVQSEPGVRFYAGAPLLSHDGFNLGTLCLLDSQPRSPLSTEQQATLVDLAALVVDELELRLAAHRIAQVDAALLKITQGVATVTGKAFLDALVQHFANVLDTDYVYIGLVEGDHSKWLRTIATCAHGQVVDNLEYPLQETPCWEVIEQRKLCCYPRDVQVHFPNAPLLKPLAVESYAAAPFFESNGTPLGLLGVMDSKPLENVHLVTSLLTIFADRIATELERQHVEQERERFFAVASDLQVITRADGYFQWVSPSFERLLGWTVEDMTSRPWAEFVHPDDINPSLLEADSLFSGNETLAFENRYRHKDGSYRWLLWRAQPQPDEQVIYGAAVDITERVRVEDERKQAEETVRQSEERTRLAIQVAQLGTWRYNLDTNSVELDERMRQIWGKSEDAVTIPLPQVVEQIHPDDRAYVEHAVGAALDPQSLGVYKVEYRIVWDDGSERWLSANGQVQFEGDGEARRAIQFLGTALDITDRKHAEAALRESEERLRTLTATIPQLIWAATPDGRVDYLSAQWADYIGLPPERLYDWNWQQVVHPEDLPNTLRDWEHSLLSGEPLEIQHRFHYRMVEWRWQLVRGIPIKDGMGQVTKWVGTCTDIQSEVDIKTALQASEEQSRNVLARERRYMDQLQGLTIAALTINSAFSVEEVLQVITDQAAVIIGAHQSVTSVTINQNWAQAITAAYLSDKYAQWRDYDEQPDGSGIYACVCHANRAIRMTQAELEAHPHWKGFGNAADKHPPMRGWLAAPLIGRDGHNIGLIQLSDKHEGEFAEADESILIQLAQMASVAIENARLYEAEQHARLISEAAREEAQAANRVKDEFLAVLSHELRSPLNPILGWTRLLQNGKLDASRQQEALATIERNAKLQTQLIDDLLDISRIMQGKLSLTVAPVSLTFVITAAVETVRLAAEVKNIQILLDLTTEIAPVSGDAARLQQVVWNLLTNAVKFTPNGGQVTIELRQLDHLAQIRVTDTGKGIDPQFLPHVFEYFRQADATTTRKFGGLGLGLAIVRQIVEMHGGTVWAESEGENQGAIFTVQLPLSLQTRPSEAGVTRDSFTTEAPLSNLHILLVDDDTDTREFQAFLLEQSGARVTAVASGFEALQALDRFIPDVLVSDISMAEMDGYMLIQQIRSREVLRGNSRSHDKGGMIPAIALTAYARDFDQQQALQAGFQRHLSKPVEPEALVQAIARLCQRS